MVVECLPGSGFVATYTLMPDVQDRVLSKLKGQIVVTEDAPTKQNSTPSVRDFHQRIKMDVPENLKDHSVSTSTAGSAVIVRCIRFQGRAHQDDVLCTIVRGQIPHKKLMKIRITSYYIKCMNFGLFV